MSHMNYCMNAVLQHHLNYPEYALIESAARNLLSLITGTLGQEQQVQVQGQGQSQSRVLTLTQSGRQNQQSLRQPSVQQEMTRRQKMTNQVIAWKQVLRMSVIGRTMRQIKQLRKGLKETMLWPLICQHPDVVPFIFPREKNDVLTSEFVLNCIIWPSMVENNDEDDDECSLEDRSRVAGYLRQFIESGTGLLSIQSI
ncbi:G2 M phase-specific E3 ubiquitin- ligase-like isoform X1 [Labeo rohita]|uniref:G2 M phase-specific E3 ubiquitin-ligase-like isoform X1 n=1 Tax=Labeo rohita TaxID=84645 RepID=A0A498LJX4_LABRO|nr:G2 M phase-specific E3 ubiquitin- ligase-like isoform X1 [Labeo rohita]